MLNYADHRIQAIAGAHLSAKDARIKITEAYADALAKITSSSIFAANEPAQAALTLSYTSLLADKLQEALTALPELHAGFAARLWLAPELRTSGRSQITVYLATDSDNLPLLVIDSPLVDAASLQARNLPTLLQVTAKDDSQLQFDDAQLAALATLVRGLYAADYAFKSVDETVLQPVDGLAFKTKYDNLSKLTASTHVDAPGDLTLSLDTTGATVQGFHVRDDAGHDWLDLGTDDVVGKQFSWSSTTIPEELVGHALTLEVLVHEGEVAPALDELFVIASNHAILMRQGKAAGSYELALPNHHALTVVSDADTITLHYPEQTVQVLELNHQYPFLGEWLKAILPQKRAFN